MAINVVTFYHFARFPDYKEWQEKLRAVCNENGVKGTILIAAEGINSTLAGPKAGLDNVLAFIRADERFKDMPHKESMADEHPFRRLKVRLKKEIVTMGVAVDPIRTVGAYVKPEDWNALISDPDVLVIDTRNDYEFEVGTFKNAVDPKTATFGQFPAYVDRELSAHKDKKIAMFCTGGIRCEKATSLMREKGFKQVYHLEGGILKYLELVPASESLWEGDCYVFDEREAVGQGLKPTKLPHWGREDRPKKDA